MYRRLINACQDELNYLKLREMRLCGYTYGSESLLIHKEPREELYKRIVTRFIAISGTMCPFSIDDVIDAYSGCRKRNYVALRDGKAIEPEPDRLLFGIVNDGPVATVYAYLGHNARQKKRLIKIGYTSQNLTEYLRGKVIQHDPQLMATKCGGRKEEAAEHARWDRYRADGREWYYATDAMLSAFKREWDVTAEFDLLSTQALAEAPWT